MKVLGDNLIDTPGKRGVVEGDLIQVFAAFDGKVVDDLLAAALLPVIGDAADCVFFIVPGEILGIDLGCPE